MRKLIRLFSICVCFILSLSVVAFASNNVNSIDIEAVIYEDGSMYITQVWEGDFAEGTEVYIPMNAPDYLTIDELQVSDINGVYTTLDNWDVSASFEQKANKCGINYTDTGYEICFGISQYGHNRYAIEYKLSNVVAGYTDMDGINFRFVNNEMNTVPTDVKVAIRLADGTPITDEIADIWGFGYEGKVEFSDGAIIAYTEEPIYYENHVTVMFALNKGIISPARQVQDSFETVKQTAFEGSDYEDSSDVSEDFTLFDGIVGIGTLVMVPVGFVLLLINSIKNNRKRLLKKYIEKIDYYRDLPNKGNINASYVLGKQFEVCKEDSIIAVGILRLIELGCLQPVIEQEVGFMGKTKETVDLHIINSIHEKMNEYDEYLYSVLEGAAGTDHILQAKELGKFISKNDRLLRSYINKCDDKGKRYLSRCFKNWDIPARLNYLTEKGELEFSELLGFQKYLTDFSLIAERGINEIPIWKELLTYAMLFGVADKLAQQMKELYPNISSEVTAYAQYIYTANSYHTLMYRNMRDAEQQREQRLSGSGGSSSFGGGGGSVGGGSGGGTR